ncbi:MAG: hypothetical protein IPN29_18995 [Saprospiraceae bacterium]|nr:hypothetical protein [Saprospiraceae bacterium]
MIDKILFIYANGGFRWNSSLQRKLEIRESDMDFMKKCDNTIPEPDNISIENQQYLNRCHRIFFKGISCKEPVDIVSCFWQYWEAAFYFYSGKQKGEKIIKDLAMILAKDKSKVMKIEIGFLLYSYAMNNCQSNTFGILPDFYMKRLNSSIPEELDNIVSELKESTTYPFLIEIIERYYSINESDDLKWHKFYTQLLWQLYEQRNFIHHDGTYCEATLEQLRFYFRTIIVRWQCKLFTEMEMSPDLSIDKIIMNMEIKSRL